MMCVLMRVRDADALARACDLGVAMQLTNIARDVGEDARNGRLYLPRQMLREAGLDPDGWLMRLSLLSRHHRERNPGCVFMQYRTRATAVHGAPLSGCPYVDSCR
mgnify:CR=1 FL=1